jgi:hypothetical protein
MLLHKLFIGILWILAPLRAQVFLASAPKVGAKTLSPLPPCVKRTEKRFVRRTNLFLWQGLDHCEVEWCCTGIVAHRVEPSA